MLLFFIVLLFLVISLQFSFVLLSILPSLFHETCLHCQSQIGKNCSALNLKLLIKGVHLSWLQHLRTQYDELFPALCNDHPDIFPTELYTWDKFLWACELWYSNGMKVMFTDGKLQTCLVPIAGFLNHSVCHPFHLSFVFCQSIY